MAQRGRLPLRWVLAGLLAITTLTSLFGGSLARPLRRVFRYVLVAPSDVGMYLSTSLQRRVDDMTGRPDEGPSLEELRTRDQLLRQETARLRQRLADAEADLANLRVLRRAFQALPGRIDSDLMDMPWELIPARVVGYESLPYGDRRTLGRGSSSGAGEGDLVITRRQLSTDRAKAVDQALYVLGVNALVGKLGQTNAFTAELILLTDRKYSDQVIIYRDLTNPRMIPGDTAEVPLDERNNHILLGQASGDGETGLLIRGIAADARVLPGDYVLTGVKESFIPAPIPIGRVDDVVDDPQGAGTQIIHVTPDADLSALRRVYIVYPLPGGRSD